MNNQWQDNLRNRMEHHEEPVPEGLWESVEQGFKSNGGFHQLCRKVNLILVPGPAVVPASGLWLATYPIPEKSTL